MNLSVEEVLEIILKAFGTHVTTYYDWLFFTAFILSLIAIVFNRDSYRSQLSNNVKFSFVINIAFCALIAILALAGIIF